jgi:hypothetical protein
MLGVALALALYAAWSSKAGCMESSTVLICDDTVR